MTATDIIATIIEMHKDYAPGEVQDLISGKAVTCDFEFIREELEPHVSGSEMNAAREAVEIIDTYFARA